MTVLSHDWERGGEDRETDALHEIALGGDPVFVVSRQFLVVLTRCLECSTRSFCKARADLLMAHSEVFPIAPKTIGI